MSQQFVIHEHNAERAGHHFDLRLENGGVLLSWAVPKGIPPKGIRHLAIKVEDHPIEYSDFEGRVPSGYGKGDVRIYDEGVYDTIIHKGDTILVFLHGNKIVGKYYLKHWARNNWLLWKAAN